MTPARGNAAYDLTLFEPKEERKLREREEEESGLNETVEVQKKQRTAAKKSINAVAAVRWGAVSLFIVVSLVAIMMCNVQLTSIDGSISSEQSKLSAAQSDQVRLNVELESRASLSSVEDYAVNQEGLQKASQYQMTYVHLTDKDKVVVSPQNVNIFSKIINFFLEYL